VTLVRNPIAAAGGVDPETIEEVRRLAPDAFRAEQFRAVTEADYQAAAMKLPAVSGAVAAFRWTGSWYTVFVGVDPTDPADFETGPTGLPRLRPTFERLVRAQLTRYRLAGYDLELRPPRFAPIELDLDVCVSGGHFRGDVLRAIRDAMGNRMLPGGRLGFFHPANFTFGQAVYASRIYAAVEAVEGVDSLVITRFRRYGQVDNGELETGRLAIGPWEIAQLDNDPSFLEHGVLRLTVRGGKG
jgi:predicted phage baseplate assembly protein